MLVVDWHDYTYSFRIRFFLDEEGVKENEIIAIKDDDDEMLEVACSITH